MKALAADLGHAARLAKRVQKVYDVAYQRTARMAREAGFSERMTENVARMGAQRALENELARAGAR